MSRKQTMKLFTILPDKKNWGNAYSDDIIARRAWSLPGVECSECGNTWALIGVDYPLVDISQLAVDDSTFKPRAAPVEEYLKLKDLVAPFLTKGIQIPPGTGLGPLVGKGTGKCGDFAWPNSWTLLIKQSTYQGLQSMDLRLPSVAIPQIEFNKNSGCDLFEFQIEPQAYLASESYDAPEPRICPRCGRDDRKVQKLVIDKSTIPTDSDMYRIKNFPTYILVTERFKDTVIQLNLTNIIFEDIKIA
jgi:uncharacterized double-CXXCG motif protein